MYYAASEDAPIQLLSTDLSAYELDDLLLTDSVVFVYRNSLKMDIVNEPFLKVFKLYPSNKKVEEFSSDNDVNASVYSYFHNDSRNLCYFDHSIWMADYVLPRIYRYSPGQEKRNYPLDLPLDSFNIIPDSTREYLNGLALPNAHEYIDTVLSLKFIHYYCNRQLVVDRVNNTLILFFNLPDTTTQNSRQPVTQFGLFELGASESKIEIRNRLLMNRTTVSDKKIESAVEVLTIAHSIIHVYQTNDAFYFVIRNATNLSPMGMSVGEYAKANYPLQFGQKGYAVVRVMKSIP